MWFNCSKLVLVLSTISMCFAGSVLAGGGSGGHSGRGSGHSSGGCNSSSTTTACDTWEDALIYDMYLESTNNENIDEGWDASSASTVVVSDVEIQVSAWSDTDGGSSDNVVAGADIAGPWGSSELGYGIYNSDETSFDNHSHAHAIDNLGSAPDTDMILFTFSEEVSLSGAIFSWADDNGDDQEVSVMGLSSVDGLTGESSTWSEIASTFGVADTIGSFSIEECDDVYQSTFTTTGTAQYWLVGAYNAAFAYVDSFTNNNDAFKLASIGFEKVSDDNNNGGGEPVNAPGSLALLLLAGSFAAWRRKQAL